MGNQQPYPDRNCKHCDKLFTPTRYNNFYCSTECNRLFRRNKTYDYYTRPAKNCTVCGAEYIPSGQCSKYCNSCRESANKQKKELTNLKYRSKHQLVGVGSGKNQGKGKDHHSYKTGIGLYKQQLQPQCELCGVEAVLVHHIDHNRLNNEPNNLQSLCKRCHQLEHRCWENLPGRVQRLSLEAKLPT